MSFLTFFKLHKWYEIAQHVYYTRRDKVILDVVLN